MVYFNNDGRYIGRQAPYHRSTESYCVSLEELDDVIELIKHDKMPNGEFSDDECAAWMKIRRLIRSL